MRNLGLLLFAASCFSALAKPTCSRVLLAVHELEAREVPSIAYGVDLSVVSSVTGRGVPHAAVTVVDASNGQSYAGSSGIANDGGVFVGGFTNPNDQDAYTDTQTQYTYGYVPAGQILGNGSVSTGEYGYSYQTKNVDHPAVYQGTYTVTIAADGYTTASYSVPVNFDARVLAGTLQLTPSLDRTPLPVVTHLAGVTDAYVVGGDAGSNSFVEAYQPGNPNPVFSARPFPGFAGGTRAALGDVNGDGVEDVAAGAGPGGGPHVVIYSGADGSVLYSDFVFDPAFTGGVNIALGDVNGDGKADLVVGADAGAAPHLKVISVADGTVLMSTYAFAPSFAGGIRVAVGDLDGDGKADPIAAAGSGGAPHVIAFSGANGSVLRSFYAYDEQFLGGVYVGAGDLDGDGKAEIVTGAGAGGGSDVRVFGQEGLRYGFFAYDGFYGGVRVGVANGNIVTGAGPTGGPHAKVYRGSDGVLLDSRFATAPRDDYSDGIFVGP